jgi:hypothetical protein
MADLTKLAGTFKAARLTVGVSPKELGIFIQQCLDWGVQVNPTNEIQDDWIRCRVTLPQNKAGWFERHAKCAILNHQTIELMCPLPDNTQ